MKKGYFTSDKGSFFNAKRKGGHIEFVAYSKTLKLVDPGIDGKTSIPITDEKTKFAWFFKNWMNDKYYEYDDEFIAYCEDLYKEVGLKFVEVE